MSSFMDQMAQQNTPEYLQKKKYSHADSSYIMPVIEVIKDRISHQYSDHHISGYICEDHYDGDDYWLTPKPDPHNQGVMKLPDEPDLVSYIQKQLDIKIRELGITQYNIEYPKLHYYRETCMYGKYIPTFKTFNTIYISISW